MIVHLTEQDRFQVAGIAKARHGPKRAENVKDRKIDANRSSIQIERSGTAGEAAVAKALGVPMQLYIGLEGDHRKGDLQWRGFDIQVKFRFYRSGCMIFSELDKFQSHLAVMTYAGRNDGDIVIAGWITRDDFLKQMERRDFGYGLHYCVPSARLRPFRELANPSTLKGLC